MEPTQRLTLVSLQRELLVRLFLVVFQLRQLLLRIQTQRNSQLHNLFSIRHLMLLPLWMALQQLAHLKNTPGTITFTRLTLPDYLQQVT